jgi:MFS transporter, DHA1 family, multidrug resistance protein
MNESVSSVDETIEAKTQAHSAHATPQVAAIERANWPAPRWLLAAMIAALATLGPFSIDTYLPAFAGIAQGLQATPVQLQQTLSSYLFGFGLMMLFHGAFADSFGRKPVIFTGVAIYTLVSIGCALAQDSATLIALRMLQGMSAGAGMVVGRVIIRDLFDATTAQKLMSQVTLFFGIAPAIAPLIGGVLYVNLGWRSIFWFLAAVGLALSVLAWRALPETLPRSQRQPFAPRPLVQGYRQVGFDPRFLLLAISSGVPFNAMFVYVLSAPVFLGEGLKIAPTQFFWFFCVTITGIMSGAFMSGRIAGRWDTPRQINFGFTVMACACVVNIILTQFFTVNVVSAMLPVWFIAFGWSLLTPAITLKVLDTFPTRRGMAASLTGFIGGCVNALVAGVVSPLVMHSPALLAIASTALMAAGFASWRVWRGITREAATL